MFKKIKLFLLLTFLPLSSILLGSSFFETKIVRDLTHSYSLNRSVSNKENDTILNISKFDESVNFNEMRSLAGGFTNAYRVYGPDTTLSAIVCYDERAVEFPISFQGFDVGKAVTNICLSNYCSGNTVDNILYELKLEMLFDFGCDWNINYGDNFDSPSYISTKTADAIIMNNSEYKNYSELIGETIILKDKTGERHYSINNIFYSDKYFAPIIDSFLCDFIITRDSKIFENNSCKLLLGHRSDMILNRDCVSYLKSVSPSSSTFFYFNGDNWVQNESTIYFDRVVTGEQKYNFNFILFFIGFFGLGGTFFYLSLDLFKNKNINQHLKYLKFILILNGIIFLLVNIINLFCYSLPFLLSIFNTFLSFFCFLNLLLYLILLRKASIYD